MFLRASDRLKSVPTKLTSETTSKKTRLNKESAKTRAKPLFRDFWGKLASETRLFIGGYTKAHPKVIELY